MKTPAPSSERPEVTRLRELSASLGRNPLLVQASTGNTSIKLEGTLWMKASGKWFVHADQEDFFVDLDVSAVRDTLRRKTVLPSRCDAHSAKLARGSVETAMHAALPYPVVVHVHSLNTVAWAVRIDGQAQLDSRLNGLSWQWLPYVPSGLPLALEIGKVFARHPSTNVFVLSNHGLVVCGDTCDAVQTLLSEVERRLQLTPRPARNPDLTLLDELTRSTAWRLPEMRQLHALATDPATQRILAGGYLYPCQAIFLPTTCPAPFHSTLQLPQSGREHFWLVDGAGVLLHEQLSRAELEMLIGLVEVVQRIDPDCSLRYLSEPEIENVLNKDAFRYWELAHANSTKNPALS